MGFNLDEIKQALKQPKSYIWDSYTSSKPSASNLVGKSDVAFGNTPQYSADSTADDFWRKSLESDSNYYESRGYTFDGTKWNKPEAEEATDFTNTLGVLGWLNTHGYNAGIIDGKYGRNTQAALNRALADSNVSEDIKNKLRTYQNNATFVPTRQRSAGVLPLRSTGVLQQTPSSKTITSPATPIAGSWDKEVANGLVRNGGLKITLNDGTIAYRLKGNIYYNNNRMKGADGKMHDYNPLNFSRSSEQSYWVPFNKLTKPEFTLNDRERVDQEYAELLKNSRFRKNNAGSRLAYINGQYMPVVVTQGSLDGGHNDRSFAYDSRSKHFIPLVEDFSGYANGTPMLDNSNRAFYYSQDDILNNRMIKGHSYKNGGSLNKYQQGGTMNNEQELQKAFMAFLIEDASTQGITIQSEEDLVKYAESLGEDGIKAKYQEFMQKMQGGVKAKLGTKLNYIRKIKGLCADDEELVYMKQGGRVCPVCQKKMEKAQEGTKVKGNAVEEFKKSRKLHVNSDGTAIDKRVLKLDIRASKCGGKVKK